MIRKKRTNLLSWVGRFRATSVLLCTSSRRRGFYITPPGVPLSKVASIRSNSKACTICSWSSTYQFTPMSLTVAAAVAAVAAAAALTTLRRKQSFQPVSRYTNTWYPKKLRQNEKTTLSIVWTSLEPLSNNMSPQNYCCMNYNTSAMKALPKSRTVAYEPG